MVEEQEEQVDVAELRNIPLTLSQTHKPPINANVVAHVPQLVELVQEVQYVGHEVHEELEVL